MASFRTGEESPRRLGPCREETQQKRRRDCATGRHPAVRDAQHAGGRLAAVTALALCLVCPRQGPVSEARGGDDWTGKRVVQKARDFTLRINDEPVVRTGRALEVYHVERSDGPSLLLKAEKQGASGWAGAQEVIPLEHAIEFFNEQIRARPRDAFPYAMRALIHQDKKEFDLALRDFDQAIALDPRDPSLYASRGTTWRSLKEYGKAVADFDAAIRIDPKNAVAYLDRGISRAASKEYSHAIADFSEAIWLDALCIAAYEDRGLAWYSKKEYEKAIVDYNMAIRLDPENALAFCRRGDAQAARRRFAAAITDYNESIRINPANPAPCAALAWLLATCRDDSLRDGEKSVRWATKACELSDWTDAGLLEILAAACAQAGDFASAVKWQSKAIALVPGSETAQRGETRIQLYRAKHPYRETNP